MFPGLIQFFAPSLLGRLHGFSRLDLMDLKASFTHGFERRHVRIDHDVYLLIDTKLLQLDGFEHVLFQGFEAEET